MSTSTKHRPIRLPLLYTLVLGSFLMTGCPGGEDTSADGIDRSSLSDEELDALIQCEKKFECAGSGIGSTVLSCFENFQERDAEFQENGEVCDELREATYARNRCEAAPEYNCDTFTELCDEEREAQLDAQSAAFALEDCFPE